VTGLVHPSGSTLAGLTQGLGSLAGLALMAVMLTGCGKKGPPLAPFPRVPAAPANVQIARVGEHVYISFTVPAANVDGQAPADIGTVELYGLTADTAPAAAIIRKLGDQVASFPVRPELPPPPPPTKAGEAPTQVKLPPGVSRGATAVAREELTSDLRVPVNIVPPGDEPAPEVVEEPLLAGPLVAITETTPTRRYYAAFASSPRGRSSAPSAVVSTPMGDGSGAPAAPEISYTEGALTLTWAAPPGARAPVVAPAEPGLLPARPIVPPPAPTTYHVYAATPPPDNEDPYALTLPAPLSASPLAVTTMTIPGVTFGVERCFEVRAVDSVSNAPIVGPASPSGCVTPRDTFPPAAPKNLEAIAVVGAINLIWDANAEPDVAGYLVLRGDTAGATLQALTATPVPGPTYHDAAVKAGVRYAYVVVAVDNAAPQNVSPQSNRVEETAR
jgi:hypothetical protein